MKFRLGRDKKNVWDKALQGLVLPAQPRTPELLLREYTRQVRGKRLVLQRDANVVSPFGPSGMWLTADGVDLVWIHPGASGMHERRIVAHELGHMVNGDNPDPIGLKDMVRLFQSVCPASETSGLWADAMCRTDFSDPREQHAEAFSYYAEDWLSRTLPPGASLIGNLQESLDTRNEYW
ncbi:hypothetical protein QFZ75_007883 [Streptomyces sp. V3I8]|uniref:hypothetical protein n=1 Tax=Streptomyces sp. V3I8 TaxID=3042279 RepID=UPI002786A65E|nr:hypothetical protein [Streptomyces sp. V3I8]MDQ1041381.1 hypothetical protein [Streptomyces sp. V3I8]